MTLHDLAPWVGVVAALGAALLLSTERVAARLAGIGLLALGGLPLAAFAAPALLHQVQQRPLVAALGGAIGLAVVAGLALVIARRPWLVPLAALATGWMRVPIGSGADRASLLLPLYAVIAAGLIALAINAVRGRDCPQRLGWVGRAFALYVLIAAVSLFWTHDLAKGSVSLVAFFLPFSALAALIGSLDPDEAPIPRAATGLIVGLGTAFAVVGAWQWETRELFWNPRVIVANDYNVFFRVNSVFWDPSVFGRFEVLAILAVLSLLAFARPSRVVIGLALTVPVMLLGLALSYSQSSLVALCAGILVIGLIALGRRWALRILAAAAILLVLATIGAAATGGLSGNLNKATSDRSSLARIGLQLFADHPLQGVGLGGFVRAASPPGGKLRHVAPHTAPIATAAELGIGGLIALAALIAAVLHAFLRAADAAEHGATLRRTALVLLSAIAVHSLFYNALFEDPWTWALAAVIASLALPRPSRVGTAPIPAGRAAD